MTDYDHYVTVHCPRAWECGWVDALTDDDIEANLRTPEEFEDAESHYLDGVQAGLRDRATMSADEIASIRLRGNPFPVIRALN
jgi:hypothetical protein